MLQKGDNFMKLIMAIVNSDDANDVASVLTKSGYTATKLSSSGGFLKQGNTTFLIGVDEDAVLPAIELIKKHSSKRSQVMPEMNTYATGEYTPFPVEVSVGGATIFVMNVEHFEKL